MGKCLMSLVGKRTDDLVDLCEVVGLHRGKRVVKDSNGRADFVGSGHAWEYRKPWHQVVGGPEHLYSIDRIDPDGHFEPGNVRWATRLEQTR